MYPVMSSLVALCRVVSSQVTSCHAPEQGSKLEILVAHALCFVLESPPPPSPIKKEQNFSSDSLALRTNPILHTLKKQWPLLKFLKFCLKVTFSIRNLNEGH